MSTKRTIINADEELVIKGKLTIEGNVTQIETTQQVTNLEGNVFTINSDGSNTSAVLALNSNGTVATMTFDDAVDKLVVNKTIVISAFGNIETTGNINAGWFHGDGSNITGLTTTIVSEGTNLYFTSARVRGNVSVVDTGGDGSLSYNTSSGVFTYTGPSAAEVRAHFSAIDGIEYSNTTGVINLANTTAGNGLTYTNGVLAVGAGDGITVNADNVAVNNTVIRITGDQTITGNTTFVGTTSVTGNIVPTAANTYNLGSWENHFDYVFANVIHVEYLDLQDANISDIHSRFFAGNVAGPYLTTNTAGGLIYTHNASAAGYQVNPGDGLQLISNTVAVDSTVIRSTGEQTITGNTSFVGNVSITGNLDVTANINSLTVVDLLVQDANIVLRSNAASDGNAHIIIERGNVNDTYLLWDAQADAWKFSNDGVTEYLIPTSTDDLIEGNANLYYTTDRANTAMDDYLVGGDGITYVSGNISVGQGDGITVNADNVAVDSSVVRTSGNQSIAGIKTFTGELVIPTGTPTSNNSIYVNAGNTAVYAYVNGVHVQLTADSDVGQVEDVGNVGFDIYAGSRPVVLGNNTVYYHGIRSLDTGAYATSNLASNVITIDANIAAIRSEFSTANIAGYGNISYNSANGLFSYSGITDVQIRGLFSASGLLSYNASTGAFTTTADNYGSWTVQTDSGSGAAESITSAETLTIQGGTGISVTNTGNVITITNSSAADIESVSAGAGLTGGGNNGNVTLDIGAGAGITVNADNVAVDQGYFDNTAGGTGWTGNFEPSANNVYSLGSPTRVWKELFVGGNSIRLGNSTVTSGGNTISVNNANVLIQNIDSSNTYIRGLFSGSNGVSYNSSVGVFTLDSNVAGSGLTYTSGVLAVGEGSGITVNADNVSVNVAHVRSQFSATSPLSYDSANGVFSITEVGDISEVTAGNGLVGGGTSGAVTLNVGAGAGITVNADNIALTSGVITAGTYGGLANSVPSLTIDTYGRVTAASNTAISITTSQISNFNSSSNSAMDAYLVGGSGLTYSSGTFAVGAGSYITVASDSVAVDASTTNTANKVVARDGAGNVYANYFVGTATAAQYADLAENYLADGDYLPGTVLVFGGDAEVTASISYESTRVAGVVTTQPAHVMNSHLTGPNVACIALRGRVPVKVKGVVRKGDVLVSAGEGHIGYAVAALDPRSVPAAAIVGKAISDKLDNGPGVVEALI